MSVWKENGKIKITEDGLIYVCDDCPCETEACPGYPSSVLMTEPGFPFDSAVITAVVGCAGISPPLPACSLTPTMCTYTCFWVGLVNASKAFLLRWNGGASWEAQRWSTSFCGPSSFDIGFWVSGDPPYGQYNNSGGSHLFTIS